MPRDPETSQPQASQPVHPEAQRPEPLPAEPLLAERSFEDTDAAWGDYREPDDNERLYRDRPPHWDDF